MEFHKGFRRLVGVIMICASSNFHALTDHRECAAPSRTHRRCRMILFEL